MGLLGGPVYTETLEACMCQASQTTSRPSLVGKSGGLPEVYRPRRLEL